MKRDFKLKIFFDESSFILRVCFYFLFFIFFNPVGGKWGGRGREKHRKSLEFRFDDRRADPAFIYQSIEGAG